MSVECARAASARRASQLIVPTAEKLAAPQTCATDRSALMAGTAVARSPTGQGSTGADVWVGGGAAPSSPPPPPPPQAASSKGRHRAERRVLSMAIPEK